MSEMAPYKKNIYFERSDDYKEYFATRFTGVSEPYSEYFDLFFCEDYYGEPVVDEAIFRANAQTFREVLTKEDVEGRHREDSDIIKGKSIIHGRIKMDAAAVFQLYTLLENVLRTIPDSPYIDAGNGTIKSWLPSDSMDLFENDETAAEEVNDGD